MISVLAREPEYMTLPELHRYIGYLQENGVGSLRYRLDFWSRLVQPLTVLAMLLLGIGFVLGVAPRSSTGWRLFTGIFVGLLFKLFNDLFAQAGLVYGLPPVFSALLPTLFVLGAAAWLLRRERV